MLRTTIAVTALATALSVTLACSKESASPVSPNAAADTGGDLAADGSSLKVTAPVAQSPVNDQQLTDAPTLVASGVSFKYGGSAPLLYHFQVFDNLGNLVADSGLRQTTTYTVTNDLAFRTRHTWRMRAESGTLTGPWSAPASFMTAEGGYLRGNEVLDPLVNGITVGERIGPTSFVPGKGIRLDANTGYVRYAIPVTITAGEFSMEVEGLRGNAPGDKSKVFSMSTNGPDFITDPYRVDIQYRGTTGFPANSVTYRVLYGSADDLNLRYEPDTAVRLSSVYNLDPNATYTWKFTWGNGEVRLILAEGGAKANGRVLYNQAVRAPRGTYNPQPMYAYLGAPSGRSGAESASIPGTIYRNVWIGARPRP